MAEVVAGQSKKNSPQYDKTKNYEWQPNDRFILTGEEFAQLYQTFSNEMNIPGGAAFAQKIDTFNMIKEVLKVAVEAGIAKEIKAPEKNLSETTLLSDN